MQNNKQGWLSINKATHNSSQNNILGDLEYKDFLNTYWQKKSCLIRQAIPKFQSFIDKDTLFQLSCREDIESRLVIERDGEYPWQVVHGPFDIEDFEQRPESHWSLLVQNVELYLQDATSLLQQFNFIPSWRIDDLMISFAPAQGSVGPHLDS